MIDSLWGLCYPRYMRHTHVPPQAAWPLRRRAALLLVGCAVGLLAWSSDGLAKTKPPRAPRPEPELKITELSITPAPYQPGNGPLDFSVTVQLPKELNGATVLEVSSLISSPSKTSLKFLSHRQDLQPHQVGAGETRPSVVIHLTWDGQDHRKQPAVPGTYAYEVRTKLLANGEKGLRTMMVSWPKRGEMTVK